MFFKSKLIRNLNSRDLYKRHSNVYIGYTTNKKELYIQNVYMEQLYSSHDRPRRSQRAMIDDISDSPFYGLHD